MGNMNLNRLNEVSELIEHALDGDLRAQADIKMGIRDAQEAHSTSDFPEAFRAITSRAFLTEYEQIQSVYTQYTRRFDVNNLRPQEFYSFQPDNSVNIEENGGVKTVTEHPGGLARLPELTEYPTITFVASETSFGVGKYGNRAIFSFEMLLNDEWGVLETLPNQLAQLARNQEDIVATEVLASETGPNPRFFNAQNGNLLAGNPALSIEAIENAMAEVRTRQFNGNPVFVGSFSLIVPPALEAEARRLLGVTAFEITDPVNGTYTYANPVSGVNLVVNPWLPVIDKSANANTTWYLLPSGSQGIRPAVVFSKLRGRENPELRMANATGTYLGGGAVPGREGSFLNDDIEFRVRHYMGAAGIAAEVTAVSNGSGA